VLSQKVQPIPGSGAGLRERKKARTRCLIQEHALRLFLAKGYEATTIEEIAAAAEVSHMTVFRYFSRKEDLVLADEYDPLILQQLAARPSDEPVIERFRRALGGGLSRIYGADRDALLVRTRLILNTPALRARLWEQQAATERLVAQALGGHADEEASELHLRVLASSCLAAVTTAVAVWAERDGAEELPDLIDQALICLRDELGRSDG